MPSAPLAAGQTGNVATADTFAVEAGPSGKITITLDSHAAGTLGFAYHGSSRGGGDSVNRGTIRADWRTRSAFVNRDLTVWLASGFLGALMARPISRRACWHPRLPPCWT